MPEGFTGIDVYRFKKDIENVKNGYEQIANELSKVISDFFYETSKIWGSPRAKEESMLLFGPISNFFKEVGIKIVKKLTDAVNAGNMIAAVNGASIISFDFDVLSGAFNSGVSNIYNAIKTIKDNIDGAVGMDGYKMMNEVIPNLEQRIKTILVMSSSIPKTIALYDANGNLKRSFSTGVEYLKEHLQDITKFAVGRMAALGEAEWDRIRREQERALREMMEENGKFGKF